VESLVNAQEAAEFLGVNPFVLRGWCRDHRVPFRRCGRAYRFSLVELDEWSKANAAPMTPTPKAKRVRSAAPDFEAATKRGRK
jgi:excisionase family DNA binding protein